MNKRNFKHDSQTKNHIFLISKCTFIIKDNIRMKLFKLR